MIIKNLIVIVLFLSYLSSYSQIVEIEGNNEGIVFPKVTLTSNVASPVEGMLVYQTGGTEGLYQYDGSSWSIIGGSANSTKPQVFTAFCGIFSSQSRFGMFGQTNRIHEYEAQFYMPQAGKISDFCVFLGTNIDANASVTVVLRKNSIDTDLTHTFTSSHSSPGTKCSAASTIVSYAVGDLISVEFKETAGVDPGSPYFMGTMNFTPD